MKLRTLRLAAGVAAVAAAVAVAAPASSLPRYTEAYNCALDGYGQFAHALAPNTKVTVAIASCMSLPVWVDSGTVLLNGIPPKDEDRSTPELEFTIPDNTSRITVTPGTVINSPLFYMEFPLAKPMANPSGSLLSTESVTIGRVPAEFTIGTEKQFSNEADIELGKNSTCTLQAGPHVYKTSTLTVTKKGKYAIRVVSTDPTSFDLAFDGSYGPMADLFLAVYPDHERPWNPTTRALTGCSDDANDWVRADAQGDLGAYTTESGTVFNWRNPWAKLSLKPGKYTLVWTTYDVNNTYDWSRGNTMWGDTFNAGASTLTYEVWGPSGSLAN